jgi:hypothetical protein
MSPMISALFAFAAVAFGIIALALLWESVRTLVRRRDLEKRHDNAMEQLQQQTLVERELVDSAQRRLREAQALARLETMVSMSALRLPERAMRQQIASAIDIVVQLSRLSDGTRKIMSIGEINGMEGDVITMQDIFTFEQSGIDENGKVIGRLRPTGIRPKCLDKLGTQGFQMAADAFADVPSGMPAERTA